MLFPTVLALPMSYIPLGVLQSAATLMLKQILQLHPDLFARLGKYCEKRYAFLPSDVPLAFVVEPSLSAISVRRKAKCPSADATVEGPIFLLLALLEGRQDADALFFSRDLTVTGDMEAMLALRNALDDNALDLARDLGSIAGPLAPFVNWGADRLRSHILLQGNKSWN